MVQVLRRKKIVLKAVNLSVYRHSRTAKLATRRSSFRKKMMLPLKKANASKLLRQRQIMTIVRLVVSRRKNLKLVRAQLKQQAAILRLLLLRELKKQTLVAQRLNHINVRESANETRTRRRLTIKSRP